MRLLQFLGEVLELQQPQHSAAEVSTPEPKDLKSLLEHWQAWKAGVAPAVIGLFMDSVQNRALAQGLEAAGCRK